MSASVTRRDFFGTCLVGAGGTALAPGAAKCKYPLFALCMDTHDARKRSLAEQAQLLKELGYDGAGHLWLEHVPERLSTLDDAGLRLFQIYVRLNLAAGAENPYDPRLRSVLPLLEGRGTMLAVLITGGKPSDVTGDVRAVALIREMAGLAQPHGVRLALYHHVGDWLERVQDAERVAVKAGRPDVGVMFNLCHWLKGGNENEMEPLLRSVMPHLFAVSIHGADSAVEIRSGKGNWIQPLGSGSFDVFRLLKVLRDLGYQGPLGLQCYGLPGDARDHLSRSMAAWRDLCQRLNANR